MQKFKILIVGPMTPPYTGMSVVTEEIVNSSLKDKFDIIHLDTSDKRTISHMGKFDFINIKLAFKHSFIFLWLCIRKKPDLVYLPIAQNFFGYMRDALILMPCRIFRIKVSVHLHGGYFKEFYKTTNVLMRAIIRFTLRKVSGAIVLGECLKYIFEDFIPKDRIFVVPNGVDDNFDSSYSRSADKVFRVLFLSNLHKSKGVLEVLKVIPLIISRHKNIKFIFAGEWEGRGEEKEAIEFVERNKIKSYVDFAGIVQGATKRKLLNSADIFILPTFYPFEGQPITILEALSAGLPIISTKRGAIGETIREGENGFLVQDRNPAQLLEKMQILISNPGLCAEMRRRNRQVYLEKYTKDIFINSLYNVLLGLVRENVGAVKNKVLFIAPLPPPFAGPEVQTTILLNSSLKNKFDLIHICSNLHLKNTDKGKIDLSSTVRFMSLVLKILAVLLYKRPKVVYTQLSQNISGFVRDSLLILICKIFGRKIVLHFHGSNFDNFYKHQPYYFQLYIGFILRRTIAFVIQAHRVKDLFLQLAPKLHLKVIYNSIQPFCSAERKLKDRSSDSQVKVFYMSYISVAKGFAVLANAIREVVKRGNDIKFFIAGGIINSERNIFYSQDGKKIDFEDMNKIVYDIKNDPVLGNRVTFLNEITSENEKMSFLFDSDIFVLPSYSEGCPMVALEAMAAGLPVIVTPVGALPEILRERENGLFVKIGDSTDLAEKISFLANNPNLRREMGRNNKLLIESKFGVEVIVSQLSKFLQDVISDSFDKDHSSARDIS